MHIKGLGTDLLEIKRLKQAIERHGEPFLNRVFTTKERDYCNQHTNPYPHFAARFAAKEAIVKALGTGFNKNLLWQDIEILNDEKGKPFAELKNQETFLISLSHTEEYALATAIWVES